MQNLLKYCLIHYLYSVYTESIKKNTIILHETSKIKKLSHNNIWHWHFNNWDMLFCFCRCCNPSSQRQDFFTVIFLDEYSCIFQLFCDVKSFFIILNTQKLAGILFVDSFYFFEISCSSSGSSLIPPVVFSSAQILLIVQATTIRRSVFSFSSFPIFFIL